MRLAWARGFGFADIENRRPMTAGTIQNIGSVTKTVTTTLVLQDIEVGRLDLDGDINRYLPFPVRNPNHAQVAITIRQLLTHRSSIRDGEAYGESYRCGDRARILSPETAAMALAPVHYERALGWDYVPRYFGTQDPIPGAG